MANEPGSAIPEIGSQDAPAGPRHRTEETDIAAKRKQVAAQYRVVAHLCKQIGHVHEQMALIHDGGHADQLLDMVGRDTADRMEALGNILNNMDAVSDEDDWVVPIFEESHKRWPIKVKR